MQEEKLDIVKQNSEAICFLKDYVKNPNIQIGDYTIYHDFENPYDFEKKNVLYNYPVNNDRLIIGKFCSIAHGAKFLMNGANHTLKSLSNFPIAVFNEAWNLDLDFIDAWDNKGGVTIGNDVWIGFEAIIYAGVTIGDGAVIASRSIVTKNVPPYSIYGGTPAHFIRQRFPEQTQQFLTKLKWWDWPLDKVKKYSKYLVKGDVEELSKLI